MGAMEQRMNGGGAPEPWAEAPDGPATQIRKGRQGLPLLTGRGHCYRSRPLVDDRRATLPP
jgi:hypothetical protein